MVTFMLNTNIPVVHFYSAAWPNIPPPLTGKDSPELRVVGIHFNPAPDAEDRLRRIFTILLEHAARERQAAPEDALDATPEDDAWEEA